jgi:hypothetical protein
MSVPIRPDSSLKISKDGLKRTKTYETINSELLHVGGQYSCFDNDVGTFVAGVKTRVLLPVPQMNTQSAVYRNTRTAIKTAAKKLSSHVHIMNFDEMEVFINKNYAGKKRTRYLAALESLRLRPIQPEDAKIKAFVKLEMTVVPEGKFYKPRIIQYRSDRYLVYTMMWLKHLEEGVYSSLGVWNPKDVGKECAKSANPTARAQTIERKILSLADPWQMSLDGSAFDAHVGVEALELEHLFYMTALREAGVPGNIRTQIAQTLRWQLDNRCSAKFPDGHVSYRVKGNRMSGDATTSVGNSILMSAYVTGVMRTLNVRPKDYRSYNDGDDHLLIITRLAMPQEDDLVALFTDLGQEVKVEGVLPLSDIENVDFCSSKLVRVDSSVKMVRNPIKALNGYLSNHTWFKNRDDLKTYMRTVGFADSLLYRNVPILHPLAYKFYTSNDSLVDLEKVDLWRVGKSVSSKETPEPPDISYSTRASFARAFNIDPAEQLWYEEQISKIPIQQFMDEVLTH